MGKNVKNWTFKEKLWDSFCSWTEKYKDAPEYIAKVSECACCEFVYPMCTFDVHCQTYEINVCPISYVTERELCKGTPAVKTPSKENAELEAMFLHLLYVASDDIYGKGAKCVK